MVKNLKRLFFKKLKICNLFAYLFCQNFSKVEKATTRVVKILENHTLDLASNYEVFSRVSLEIASKIEGFRGLPSKMPQTFQLLEASASKFEVLKPTLEKPSVG